MNKTNLIVIKKITLFSRDKKSVDEIFTNRKNAKNASCNTAVELDSAKVTIRGGIKIQT